MSQITSDARFARPGTDGSAPDDTMVETVGLGRDFQVGSSVVHALQAVDLRVGRGELVAVRGRSGSGKTTLLSLIGGLDRPSAGRVTVDRARVDEMDQAALVRLRRHKIGFIFQAFGLLSILSAAENVEVPLRLIAADTREREERVAVLLQLVGLGERANHRPHELSGGEQQRVAIARALANRPDLLLADEPTGQLDSGTGRSIMSLLRSIVRSEGLTAIIATHDPMLIDLADRSIELRDGRIVGTPGSTGPNLDAARGAMDAARGGPPLG
jgi:putative ABC transport system ATP-binding protein